MTNKINKNTQIYISKTLIYPTKIKPHNQHHHINTQKPSQTNSKTSHSLNLTQIHKSNNLSKCHLLTKQFTQTSHINNSKSIKIKLKVLHFPWILTNLNGSKIKPCARLESNNYLSKKTISPLLKFEFLFYFVFFPNPLQQHFYNSFHSAYLQRFRISYTLMETIQQTDLITLKVAKENERLQSLKPRFTQYPKQNSLIIYDNTSLFIINRDQMKNFNLGKQYLISQLAFHFERDIVVFLTAQGQLYAQFLNTKALVVIKKQVKKPIIFDWVYGVNNIFQFFIADQKGIQLFKVDEQKKVFKDVKSLSGKYNSFLYEPLTQTLVGFPIGDCKQVQIFVFHSSKYSNWFKLNPVPINFCNDESLVEKVLQEKSLGLDWGQNNLQLFTKSKNQSYYANLIKINKKCYLVFFFAEQGFLKLFSMFDERDKQVVQKLPSDSIPDFVVVDNMFVVHLKVQGITFIYDLNGNVLQPLVSPYPLRHKDQCQIKKVYEYAFLGQRAIHPKGIISKWEIQLSVIFNYLKNELQIFDFLHKRKEAKMEILTWLRRNIFTIKELNLSKFWKNLFIKYLSNLYPETEVINLIDLFSNVFYTLSQEELISKQKLLNIILECIRQALQVKMSIPLQLQDLLLELLIEFRRYETLVYLLHHDVIKDSLQLAKKVTQQYFKTHDMMLGTLAVDMTFRSGSCKEMLKILVKLERIRDAKKFIKQYYDKIEVLYLIEVAKYIKNPVILQDYLRYIKSFILMKCPTMNIAYLNQAEEKLAIPKTKQTSQTNSHSQTHINSVNLLSDS